MRLIIPAAAGVVLAALVACSGPATPDKAEASRPILLPTALPSGDGVASDLETGRTAKANETAQPRRVPTTARAVKPALAALAPVPAHVMNAGTAAEPALELMAAPVAPPVSEPVATGIPVVSGADEGFPPGTWHGHHVDEGGGGLGGYGRSPGIIIRGGMGGVEDKCDLRPRGGRGAIAINRSAPPIGGGYGPGIR